MTTLHKVIPQFVQDTNPTHIYQIKIDGHCSHIGIVKSHESNIMKLKVEHPQDGQDVTPRTKLTKIIVEAIESLPHAVRLYPDLYANSLADIISSYTLPQRIITQVSTKGEESLTEAYEIAMKQVIHLPGENE